MEPKEREELVELGQQVEKRFVITHVNPIKKSFGKQLHAVVYNIYDRNRNLDISITITAKEYQDYLAHTSPNLLDLVVKKIREFDAAAIVHTFDFSKGLGVEFD